MKKCIIFDMDGTLVDSSVGITGSINHVRSHLGLSQLEKEELVRYINDPNEHLPTRFYKTPDYDPEHKALFTAHYLEHCTHALAMYEGIDIALEALASKAMLTVATNASDFFAEKMLAHCGIGHLFERIVGANTYGVSKPDPRMLLELLEEYSIAPRDAILVGDSLKDAYAAKSAEIPFVYVTWGFGSYNPQTPHVAHTAKELQQTLERLLF